MTAIANASQVSAWNGAVGQHWADNHDRYDAVSASFNDALLAAADIGERDRVLDIGCGNGQITRLAAGLARYGSAVGIDVSEPMLDRARTIAWDNDFDNVTFERGDAQVHPFPAGGYDVAVSRGGVMFFDDLVAAFANVRRALRPGGRLAIMTPDEATPDSHGWRIFAAMNAVMRDLAPPHDPETDPAPRMASLASGDRIRDVLTAAGFAAVTPTRVAAPVVWGRGLAEAAEFIVATGKVRMGLGSVDSSTVDKARSAVAAALAPYETADGVHVPGSAWITTALA